jgi:DNA-binding NtrC family response regulator
MQMESPAKILLVDDEPAILQTYRRLLARSFEVDTASEGPEALALMDSNGPYAVVVSDLRMPGQDGLSFLRESRTRCPQTIRLLISGGDDERVDRAVEDGTVFAVMQKPCPLKTLLETLRGCVEKYLLEKA